MRLVTNVSKASRNKYPRVRRANNSIKHYPKKDLGTGGEGVYEFL